MRIFSLLLALTVFMPATVAAEELSDSPQFRYRAHRTRAISRPSHRSVERLTNVYRSEMAYHRKDFQEKLKKIEAIRDTIRDEFIYEPDPGQDVLNQDFTPYHWYIRRRHVRHQYWDSFFQQGTAAHVGQGLLGQPDLVKQESYRNDIEVEAGGR